MRILVVAVGRARGDAAQSLFQDYVARLPWRVELREVQESKRLSGARLRDAEAQLLLKAVPAGATTVVLDAGGEALSSEAFAAHLRRWRDDGAKQLAFLIGGADGHGREALKRADLVLSLGAMTWPHLLVRAMLAEQLWRGASILAGHPYHRA